MLEGGGDQTCHGCFSRQTAEEQGAEQHKNNNQRWGTLAAQCTHGNTSHVGYLVLVSGHHQPYIRIAQKSRPNTRNFLIQKTALYRNPPD
ncbi:MAG: hypothetical protein WA029_04765, partial [Anaerolineae bacterium]